MRAQVHSRVTLHVRWVDRLEHRFIAIGPASDPAIHQLTVERIPDTARRYPSPLDFVLIDLGYYPIVNQILAACRLTHDVCLRCLEGNPCAQWNSEAIAKYMRKTTRNKPPPELPKTWHLLPATDAGGWDCWLLNGTTVPFDYVTEKLNQAAPFGHHYDKEVRAWSIDADVCERVKRALGQTLCKSCAKCEPCEVWDTDLLIQECFEPRGKRVKPWVSRRTTKAAAALGLEWPAKRTTIQIAFKKLALTCHPDHGGKDSDMRCLIEAREHLWSLTTE